MPPASSTAQPQIARWLRSWRRTRASSSPSRHQEECPSTTRQRSPTCSRRTQRGFQGLPLRVCGWHGNLLPLTLVAKQHLERAPHRQRTRVCWRGFQQIDCRHAALALLRRDQPDDPCQELRFKPADREHPLQGRDVDNVVPRRNEDGSRLKLVLPTNRAGLVAHGRARSVF